jgi:hypothetical protein
MLKRIPKSDISIRPFKAYKEWSFNDESTDVSVLYANNSLNGISDYNDESGSTAYKSLYGQLRAQFYYDTGDNVFLRSGHKKKSYTNATLAKERYLGESAKVISIPNKYIGEGIKKGSVSLIDDFEQLNEMTYTDDSFGNLEDSRDAISISRIDIGEDLETGIINFTDLAENPYSASLIELDSETFDIQNNILTLIYNNKRYEFNLISLDINSGIVIVEDIPFLPEEAQGIKVGNVFYNQGLIVLTRDVAEKLQNRWKLDYKSTKTIYEHEYLLIADQDEFNVSQNPSAVVTVGGEYESFTDTSGNIRRVYTKQPTKYIRKASSLENATGSLDYTYTYSGSIGTTKAGFEHWDLSGSMDSTGSFLAPFITTIGLYDDDCDLIAVAKLPQPIKSEHDLTVNFIVRFDT